MSVDYNDFAKTFSQSRKNMSWPELEYFFESIQKQESVLDIGCGNGRLLEQFKAFFSQYPTSYTGVDLSQELLGEARKIRPDMNFIHSDMRDIFPKLEGTSFQNIFLIASFHHLNNLNDRVKFLKDLHEISQNNTKVYMTNWHLLSDKNKEKYKNSRVQQSENEFGSCDFQIKIGEYSRYYHSFSLAELNYLAEESRWKIIENRVFSGDKNIVTILTKEL